MVSPNVWPSETILPGFEAKFEALCQLIVDVAALVARSCDRYGVAKLEGYKAGTLEDIVRTSVSTKARLLHYFPPPASTAPPATDVPEKVDDDWCATHTDLGALTGLTSQMFVDESAHPARFSGSNPAPLPELDAHPDPKAGLWIRDRAGRTTQVHIPRDSLAFQTGMALQLITRGKLQAVPHFVRGGKHLVAERMWPATRWRYSRSLTCGCRWTRKAGRTLERWRRRSLRKVCRGMCVCLATMWELH
jgi:isopenicillin N synthase-like dioxygenase